MSDSATRSRIVLIGLCLIVLTAFALRYIGVDEKSISHPEVYAPGIELAAEISEPPPRYDFEESLTWHFHEEPHPVGYYMGMFAWTSAFGTSELALRLPGVVLGALSVIFVFLIGRRVYGDGVGLAAGDGQERAFVQLFVPDAAIGLARFERAAGQDDQLQERLPKPGRIIYDALVG